VKGEDMEIIIEKRGGTFETIPDEDIYEIFFEWLDKEGNKNSVGVREDQDFEKDGIIIECGPVSSQLKLIPVSSNIVRIKTE